MAMTPAPLTTASVARRLSVSEGTVRGWVRGGRLSTVATTESGVRLFDPQEVDRLAQQIAGKRAR